MEPRLSQVTMNFQGSCEIVVEEKAVRKRTARTNFIGIVFLIPRPSLKNTFVSVSNVVIYYAQVIGVYLLVLCTNQPCDYFAL